VDATPAVAIREALKLAELKPWARAAFAEIDAAIGASATGPAGDLVDDRFFTQEAGEITLFIPCSAAIRATGRVWAVTISAAELAVWSIVAIIGTSIARTARSAATSRRTR
jgi:hypothetical protein